MIEDGEHLLNCLRYVDMNMVRCGVVKHPQAWRWCGYDELVGVRKRYRIIDVERLLDCLSLTTPAELADLHECGIREQIEGGELQRAAQWTEALAVGDKQFVANAKSFYQNRCSFTETEIETLGTKRTWMIRERPSAYTLDSSKESHG